MQRGELGSPLSALASEPTGAQAQRARALLNYVGYTGSLQRMSGDLPHIDKRLLEIARALALRPSILMLDEPAAGLNHTDKVVLAKLLRRIADTGLAVVLIEHDMSLVMGISDQLVVLDAGKRLAHGKPEAVRNDKAVIEAYLGGAQFDTRPRAPGWQPAGDAILSVQRLTAGYGAATGPEKRGPRTRQRRAGSGARRQRRRQINPHALAVGAATPGGRHDSVRRAARSPPSRRIASPARDWCWCPKDGRCFPSCR